MPLLPGLIFIVIGFFLYKKARDDANFKEIFSVNPIKFSLYLLYLIKEIFISNVRVSLTILKKYEGPSVFTIRNQFKTKYGATLYANSVTLPPETIILKADEEEFVIHALTPESAEDCLNGVMHRKVLSLEEDLLKARSKHAN